MSKQFDFGGLTIHTITPDELAEITTIDTINDFVIAYSGDKVKKLQLGMIKGEQTVQNGSVYYGPDEPKVDSADKASIIWIDTDYESIDYSMNSTNVSTQYLLEVLNGLEKQVGKMEYILNDKLDCGYFGNAEPGGLDEEDSEDEENPLKTYEKYNEKNQENLYAGTVNCFTVRRGYQRDLVNETAVEGQLLYTIDTNRLYIGDSTGRNILIAESGSSGGGGSSSGNVTGEYVKLETPDGQYYRLKLNNQGELLVVHDDAFVITPPDVSSATLFNGLIINQAYGGGVTDKNIAPVTHSFIELYNNTDNVMNLKGLSLQIAEYQEEWQVVELCGLVKPRTSFLIRFSRVTNEDQAYPRLKINHYDQDCDMELPENGFKAYLCIGLTKCEYDNPFNIDGNWAMDPRFIDCISFGGDMQQPIDATTDKGYLMIGNYYTGIRRIDFNYYRNGGNKLINTNNDYEKNVTKLALMQEAVDWRYADVDLYRPRCQADGKFDVHFDKMDLKADRPTNINISFGQDGDNTRLFNWQTRYGSRSRLKYRKKGTDKWTIVLPTETKVELSDISAIINKARIDNLEVGIYEYMVGEEGRWSDTYTFEVKKPSNTDQIKIMVHSDQQSWNEYEYSAWEKCANFLYNNEEEDFIINVGDISQNGNKAFEWRYYYEFGKDVVQNHVHMNCCGNNDLSAVNGVKIDPTSYTYYSNNENMDMPSMYSFNYGYIHFVCLNSNANFTNRYLPFNKQIEWLKADLAKAENKKHYTIVYMHESPYTIVRKNAMFDEYHSIFVQHDVDLVLCGHHHMYSRSHGMGAFIGREGTLNASGKLVKDDGSAGIRGEDSIVAELQPYKTDTGVTTIESRTSKQGVNYIMTQACGYKLKGKTTPADPAPWRAYSFRNYEPMYVMLSITYDKITVDVYEIRNIVPLSDPKNDGATPYRELVDQIVIQKTKTI